MEPMDRLQLQSSTYELHTKTGGHYLVNYNKSHNTPQYLTRVSVIRQAYLGCPCY